MIKESEFIKVIHGMDVDVDGCIQNLRSMSKIIDIYEYHKCEAYKYIKQLQPEFGPEALRGVLQPTKKDAYIKLKAQANIQAAIYNARSLYDILSCLINIVFLQGEIDVWSCNIGRVSKKLDKSPMKSHIESTLNGKEYLYVNGFVNTIKHRDLVVLSSSVDFVSEKTGIRFDTFKYKGEVFPSLWAIEALSYVHYIKNEIINIFMSLIKELNIKNKCDG